MEVNNDEPDELSLCIRPGALHKQKGDTTYATVSFEVLLKLITYAKFIDANPKTKQRKNTTNF